MKIEKTKGTKDFYPKEKAIQNYIFNIWKSTALKFGYEEIEAPILEPLELYTEKSGQEIVGQMYVLEDKSGRKLALRPELTPSIARMVAQDKSLQKPLRWFSIPYCFRYERQQQGRSRQFSQFNVDLLGLKTMKADAEIIAIVAETMKAFSCTEKEFTIGINNRKLINSIIENLKIKDKDYLYKLIDKKSKMPEEEFIKGLKDIKLTNDQIKSLNKLFSIKNIDELKSFKYDEDAFKEIKELFSLLKAYDVLKYCKLDLTIVRGLDYYTSTVFEVYDTEKEFRAIAGGGRYDNLVDIFGGEPCPGIGFGMGDVVLELFLTKLNKIPELSKQIDFFIATINVDKEAVEVAAKLRKKYNVELNLTDKNIKKQLDYANSIKAKNVLIIGEEEVKKKKVTLKDMKTGKESLISIDSLIK